MNQIIDKTNFTIGINIPIFTTQAVSANSYTIDIYGILPCCIIFCPKP